MKRRKPRRPLPTLAMLLCVSCCARAADVPFSEPLTLTEAFAVAASHTPDTGGAAVGYRRPAPLYLNCDRLAFASLEDVEELRIGVIDALIDPVEVRRLWILRRFFDVLLADISFSRFNEAMAVAYIRYDRAAVRAELGQVSELRVAELDAVYQRVRHERASSEAAQRLTRSRLVRAMGVPMRLPRDLTAPAAAAPPSVPVLDAVLEAATEGNAWLHRRTGELDENERRTMNIELRQAALELVLRLQGLEAAAAAANAASAWRDLKLDESRTLYEMEVVADLGYSMSQQTKTRFDDEQVAFCRALTGAELRALQGQPVWDLPESSK